LPVAIAGGGDPFTQVARHICESDLRKLRFHRLLRLVRDGPENSLDVAPNWTSGVGRAAVQRDQHRLFHSAIDVEQRHVFGRARQDRPTAQAKPGVGDACIRKQAEQLADHRRIGARAACDILGPDWAAMIERERGRGVNSDGKTGAGGHDRTSEQL